MIASEPLTSDLRDWVSIPRDSLCVITADSDLLFEPLDLQLEPAPINPDLGVLAN